MEDSEDKMQIVKARIEERNKNRIALLEKKREKAVEKKNEEESVQFFTSQLQNGVQDAKQKLASADSVPKGNRASHFDSLAKDIQVLQKFVSDSAMFLPSYDIRAAQKQLAELQTTIDEQRDILLPKKKFAFKSKQKQAPKTTPSSNVEEPENKVVQKNYDSSKEFYGFQGNHDETLTMSRANSQQRDVTISNLHNCTVVIYGSPAVLHLKSLTKCSVQCGPTSRAIFVDDCSDTHFTLACQQLRIHNTMDSTFKIHVTSKAIIEDCTGLGFGIYDMNYHELSEDYLLSGLSTEVNNWDQVDDFNWLKLDKKSPNWYILPSQK